MAAILYIVGLFMVLVGVALGVSGVKNPSMMQVNGLTMETAALMFVGGVLTWGIGALISAVKDIEFAPTVAASAALPLQVAVNAKTETPAVDEPAADLPPLPTAEDTPSRIRFNPFTRRSAEATAGGLAVGAAAATVAAAAEPAVATSKSAVDDTIAALEQAKADITNAVGGVTSIAEEKVEDVVGEVTAPAEEEVADDELYVVEERDIRGRPARILSDNTVEAETDEGWMRFENLEHLNEYLDAMGENA
jgi:cytoskeletal protein RodZ